MTFIYYVKFLHIWYTTMYKLGSNSIHNVSSCVLITQCLELTCISYQTMDEYNTELVYKITSEVSMYCGKNPPVVSTPEYNEVSIYKLWQVQVGRFHNVL